MMTNADRAVYGQRAITAGNPDSQSNASDPETVASDTLANMAHALRQAGVITDSYDFRCLVDRGMQHFEDEVYEEASAGDQ